MINEAGRAAIPVVTRTTPPDPPPPPGGRRHRRPARTWIVTVIGHPERTEEVDHLARSAESGLSYLTGEGLPPYLGVWTDPNGNAWHLYSDYPTGHHERFGWALS